MAEEFLATDDLVAAVADASFERPPAVVANAHITGLGVARALAAHDVPVIAIDRVGDGVAPRSEAVAFAGQVTYPLDDLAGFRADLADVADAAGGEVVAFGCMDEWVHAFADAEAPGVTLPFENHADVLDKRLLYERAERLDVPYPETRFLEEADPGTVVDELGLPLVLKPYRKREGEEALGTNVLEVASRGEFDDALATARDAGVDLLAQEKVPIATGKDCSLASYVDPAGEAIGVVGNATRFPQAFGTSCLIDTVDRPAIRERALRVIEDAGYTGISEAEFIYDTARDEFVLLDINTRPWKWISLPVAAGANLPLAAYADAIGDDDAVTADTTGADDAVTADVTGDDDAVPADATGTDDPVTADDLAGAASETSGTHDARWVYLRDYLELLATDPGFWDVLSQEDWADLVTGAFADRPDLTTAVYRPDDPGPTTQLVETEFSDREYYCAC